MNPPQGSSLQRVAIAVALSILAHGVLLWQLPYVERAADEALLPPLQAKLEPLAKLDRIPLTQHKKIKKAPPPLPIAVPSDTPLPVIAIADDSTDAAGSAVAAEPTAASAIDTTVVLAESIATSDTTVNLPLLPKHAQLQYTVRYGSSAIPLGTVSHVLENIEGRYTLRGVTQTTGVTKVFKNYHYSQTSTGRVSKRGLHPENYSEVKIDRNSTLTSSSNFDWNEKKVRFSNGTESSIDDQAQDILSLPYHLSQLPLNVDNIQISLSNGRSIRQYTIAVGKEETISTAMGELRTIVLHKIRGANEEGLTIWLALEYRLLPVKMLSVDKFGEITANMVITDIRVSDE